MAELSDEAGWRVHPDKPNLYVGLTIEDPRRRFERLVDSAPPNHPVSQYGVALRPDLYEHVTASFDRATATEARRNLIKDLRRRGFVVNRLARCYRVYVILLRDVGPRRHPDKPWVYVGKTAKPVEARFREHITGARSRAGRPLYSRVVFKYGEKLLPELYKSIPCVYLDEEALRLEKELAKRLEAGGYSVRGGH